MKNSGKEKYKIIYHKSVEDDVSKIDKSFVKKIYSGITDKLALAPEIYGLPLRGTLKKYRKFRVEDYRVIYSIENKTIIIKIIGHRKDVYEIMSRGF